MFRMISFRSTGRTLMICFLPKARSPFTSPASFYPSTGAPTSLLSLRDGSPVGLGLLLPFYLAETRRVAFCPGTDQSLIAHVELAKYYEHTRKDPTSALGWTLAAIGQIKDDPFLPAYIKKHWMNELEHRQERLEAKLAKVKR